MRCYEKQFFCPHESAKARRREGTNVEAHGVRLKARKPSALENAERSERTFKRDWEESGKQNTDGTVR
ncbi:MAG: hypothetical protein LBF89_06310 [Bacteroidales bacterium]|nr:hypothetical protein [Bacteroidales bacterium]